jgi:hypothetical protein
LGIREREWESVGGRGREEWVRTSFVIELFQDLADNLPHALQGLDVILCAVKLLLHVLDLEAQVLELGLPFSRLDELGAVRAEGGLALIFGRHGMLDM